MELGSQLGLQSWHICPYVHIINKEPEVYSHPHFSPQGIPMGSHKLEHRWIKISTTSPKVLEMIVIETWRQPIGIEITQSFNVIITTT
jgi:hypothetical protein